MSMENGSITAPYRLGDGRKILENMAMKKVKKAEQGFTLIEIMVVILILGLLATIVVQSLRGATADIAELKTALDRFYIDNGYYPTSDQGLGSLVNRPTSGRIPPNYEEAGY